MSNILEAGSFVDSPKFVAAVAHDLKEPVRAIFYYSDLLMQKIENGGGEAAKPVLENIIKAAERMRLLIDNSLKFSFIAEANATITSEPLPFVAANFGGLAEVFQNLIANAVKYRGQDSPRIHVGCSRGGSEWVLSVADNGIGIEPKYQKDVFLPLKRLHSQAEYPEQVSD